IPLQPFLAFSIKYSHNSCGWSRSVRSRSVSKNLSTSFWKRQRFSDPLIDRDGFLSAQTLPFSPPVMGEKDKKCVKEAKQCHTVQGLQDTRLALVTRLYSERKSSTIKEEKEKKDGNNNNNTKNKIK
ncbi:Glucose-6-phosphate dehydrogenase (NADP(+)), partial [Trypanosoma cruzi]